jgi:hypothetical protein
VETGTTTSEIRSEDQAVLNQAIAELVLQLTVRAGRFLPDGIESASEPAESGAAEAMLFPVGRGSRSQDLAGAVRFYLPRILNEVIRGLDHAIGEQIDRLQYLGPLRSYSMERWSAVLSLKSWTSSRWSSMSSECSNGR